MKGKWRIRDEKYKKRSHFFLPLDHRTSVKEKNQPPPPLPSSSSSSSYPKISTSKPMSSFVSSSSLPSIHLPTPLPLHHFFHSSTPISYSFPLHPPHHLSIFTFSLLLFPSYSTPTSTLLPLFLPKPTSSSPLRQVKTQRSGSEGSHFGDRAR